jgi:hypothetical protein
MCQNKLISLLLASTIFCSVNYTFGQTQSITYVAPSETTPFVTNLGAQPAAKGLDGKNIALWQSHGRYFEPTLNRWEWQRACIFQTVEDLYTQSYVVPFLMPMLENAGAYVLCPRERDTNNVEYIIDNDGGNAVGTYHEENVKHWKKVSQHGFGYTSKVLRDTDNPFTHGTARQTKATTNAHKATKVTWTVDFDKAGEYAVYISYASVKNSATDATYRITDLAGTHEFKVNQQMGGGTWVYLGKFHFAAGKPQHPVVELTNLSSDKNAVITADAVKIGGGMGNVARTVKNPEYDADYEYTTSGYPRFTEAARYWLQWAGVPDSIYTPSGNENDYTDDYKSRGKWVNWLAGGSSVLPKADGLKVPVDLAFAFHSDAGTTANDSIIGTLGIYCTKTNNDGKYQNGTSRIASRELTNLVMSNVVNDVRRLFEPRWTRRDMRDKSYFEAREPEVPTMLLELLSHQNFADMKYGLDPAFRFTVSRAVYKGILKFLARRDNREYVVSPLAPKAFAINVSAPSKYNLTWSATVDSLETTATPDYYIIEERVDAGGFKQIAKVTDTQYTVSVNDSRIHSYRIIAGNDGGVSFPSEVLALCHKQSAPTVKIVNGFTRISAPDWYDAGKIAGFDDTKDHGVPYIKDISYTGTMYEYRRNVAWTDDDAAGFGSSRSDYETKVIAGNTFDFVYVHGKAIAEAGCGFISSSLEAYETSQVSDDEPEILDLILGKQKETKQGRGAYGTRFKAFSPALQSKITAFTQSGGSVFVSGAYVASDIWDNPYSSKATATADKHFASKVLGYNWRSGQAAIKGEAHQVPCRFKALGKGNYNYSNELNEDCYVVESPDSFYPANERHGCTFMRYTENNYVAGIAVDQDSYRTVVLGFPFETIKTAEQRASLMHQVLNFLRK